MLKSSFTQLKGISGAGKGTRVCQLLMFLIDSKENGGLGLDYDYLTSDFKKISRDKKLCNNVIYGISVPDINFFVCGRFVKSNKSSLISFSSADTINPDFGVDSLKWIINKHKFSNFIVEGYPAMVRNPFLSIISLSSMFDNIFIKFYHFTKNEKSEMMDRIILRSSMKNLCSGNSAWSDSKSIEDNYNLFLKQKLELNGKHNIDINLVDVSESVEKFGLDYLDFIKLSPLKEKFVIYCKKRSMLRDYKNLNDNHNKLLKFYNECRAISKSK